MCTVVAASAAAAVVIVAFLRFSLHFTKTTQRTPRKKFKMKKKMEKNAVLQIAAIYILCGLCVDMDGSFVLFFVCVCVVCFFRSFKSKA